MTSERGLSAIEARAALRAVYDPLSPAEKREFAYALFRAYKQVAKEERTGSHLQRQILRMQQALCKL